MKSVWFQNETVEGEILSWIGSMGEINTPLKPRSILGTHRCTSEVNTFMKVSQQDYAAFLYALDEF